MKKILNLTIATAFFFLSISPVPGFAFSVNVVQGNANVTTNGNTVTITATSKAILQGNISIPAGVTVKIIQGLNDILLRSTSGSITNILGSLLSNGNVILINSLGVFIGQSANINVGGLLASTLNMTNSNFMSGNYQFTKIPGLNPAQILNNANINVGKGGYVILLADQVVNNGTITAYMGSVALGSGQQATVSFDQGGLVNLVINQGLAKQLTDSNGNPQVQIINNGAIQANGGKIQITAQSLQTAFASLINNTGIIEANKVVEHGGLVDLTSNGAIVNSGTIQAGNLTEQGETFHSTGTLDVDSSLFSNLDGAIDISGNISGTISDVDDIDLIGAVTLTGDTSLIADSGDTGGYGEIIMNGNSLTGGGFNLTLTSGLNDILDGSITGVNLLTLNSSSAAHVSPNSVTFTSTGISFSVNTLQTNAYTSFSRTVGQGSGTIGDPYLIYSDSNVQGGLQYIATQGEGPGVYYQLANNINANDTSVTGFTPIGTGIQFEGVFNGNNETISNLTINLPSTNDVGLLGQTSGATIENVGLLNVNITGKNAVGSLVGYNYGSTIEDSYATGVVIGNGYVGCLVGYNDASTISNSYATGSVTGTGKKIGGLVGYNDDSNIINSYATGIVTGTYSVGGLVGYNDDSTISNSYATGSVTGATYVGGLVGRNYASTTDNSYATGSVTGTGNDIGGMVGYNYGSTIEDSYATGNVVGTQNVGGLVGYNNYGSTIDNSFAVGKVYGGFVSDFGGLVGLNNNSSVINNSYYTDTNHQNNLGSYDANGPSDFFNSTNAVYQDIPDAWDIQSGYGAIWALTGENDAFPLLQFRYSTTITDAISLQLMFLNASATYTLANNIDASVTYNWNAGLGFAPIGMNVPFIGVLNGNGYTISNLYINSPLNNVGLFGQIAGGAVENVGLVNVNIKGQDAVGGLAGRAYVSTIDNSYVTGSVSGDIQVGGLVGINDTSSTIVGSYATSIVSGGVSSLYVGGLVGVNSGAISDSYATGSVSGNSFAGGLVGVNLFGTIDNSYATGNVSGNNSVGGLAGGNEFSSIFNSYATGSVTGTGSGNAYIGGLVGYDYGGSINNSFAVGSVSGDANVGGLVGGDQDSSYSNDWYINGTGIGDDFNAQVQQDSNVSDYFNINNYGSSGGPDFNLNWDVSSSLGATWALSGDDDAFPLFQFRYSTTITDPISLQLMFLNLGTTYTLANNIDASVTSTWNAGSGFAPIGINSPFTGIFNGNGYLISNLFINAPSTSISSGSDVGLFGQTYGATIENVGLLNINITGYNNVGGLVGYNNNSSAIDNSYATGSVSSIGNNIGGLVGENYESTIDNSYATGSVNGGGINTGGLVGLNASSAIDNSYAKTSVNGGGYVGGLVGENSHSTIENSYATGVVIGGGSYVGGLVGDNFTSVIDNSYATGNVSGSGSAIGGLVGINFPESSINYSYATGSVSGSGSDMGGLVGINSYSTIDNSYATGNVTSTGVGNAYIGGLVGFNHYSSITNSYATGNVNGDYNVGGLVGYNDYYSLLDNSYATGSISGSSQVGGLVGYQDSTSHIDNSYYTDTNNQNGLGTYDPNGPSDFYGTGSGTGATFYTNGAWDFNGLWSATGNYPTLVWQGMKNGNFIGGTTSIPMLIHNVNQLQFMYYAPSNSFQLTQDIDATVTSSWNSNGSGGYYGFVPVGGTNSTPGFSGTFNGDGYTISNLYISSTSYDVGLFGLTSGATIENVGLVNANITGQSFVGSLVGLNYNSSTIDNSYATGTVTGTAGYVGGLVGENTSSSTIFNSYVTSNVTGDHFVGGLVGYNYDDSIIENSYATGSVKGEYDVGGLVGYNFSSTIGNSYAMGTVTATGLIFNVGGLVGYSGSYSNIDNSYATGSVTGTGGSSIGGLVGYNTYHSIIDNSYATGSVSGGSDVGGLVGYNLSNSTINNSFAVGSVNGSDAGGLIGNDDNSNTLTNDWSLSSPCGTGCTGTNEIGGVNTDSTITDYFTNFGSGSGAWEVYSGWDISSSLGHTWALSGDDDAFPLFQFGYSTTITNLMSLQLMFLNLGATYTLANNIDATATTNWNAGNGFAPIGMSSPFTGIFNGNGYTISNLYINSTSNDVGLFGQTSGASIENVGLTNVNITGHIGVGGLVGYNNNSSSIDNSYATGSVNGSSGVGGLVGYNGNSSSIDNSYATGSVSGSGSEVGGLVGLNFFGSIANSYATGSVSGSGYDIGGFVGSNYSSSIANSYATGSVSGGGHYVGGLVGYNNSSSIANSYATGSVSGNSEVGGLVGYNINSSSIDNSYATGSVSGSVNVGGLVGFNQGSLINDAWWTGSTTYAIGADGNNGNIPVSSLYSAGYATSPSEDDSSIADFFSTSEPVYSSWDISSSLGHTWALSGNNDAYPLLQFGYSTTITNVVSLALMFLNLGATYTLANNIDATATSNWNDGNGFAPISTNSTDFTGTFNGNGYTISNLFINNSSNGTGLFSGTGTGATVENIGLVNVNITGGYYTGGLVGYNNGSTITNSYVTGIVSGGSYVGGLVGYNTNGSKIDNSYATSSVTGSVSYVGGLVGDNISSNINNSYAAGLVTGSDNFIGGLVGRNTSSTINDSYAIGSVNGSSWVGGLVGFSEGSNISNSYATGSVSSGAGTGAGGLVGGSINSDTIINSYSTGTVNANEWVGGLVGYTSSNSTIDNSYATGTVSGGLGADVGGFIGYDNGSSLTNDAWWTGAATNAIGHDLNTGSFDPTLSAESYGTDDNAQADFYSSSEPVYAQGTVGAWDFNGLWSASGSSFPTLIWQGMNNGDFIGGTHAIPMLISNVNQLQFMYYAPSDSFQLTQDIDASATSSWNSNGSGGYYGFVSVGGTNSTADFSGTFNGDGYTISNLYINSTSNDVGLFGQTSGATIENVGLVNVNITGNNNVGGMVGYSKNGTTIDNSYTTGSVTGDNFVGGMVGYNKYGSTIDNSYTMGIVTGTDDVGGLVGYNYSGSDISNSYATGSVTGSVLVGGLVGYNNANNIYNSYATGSKNGNIWVGGLVGFSVDSNITNSYATGSVSGTSQIGGLVGYNNGSTIDNSYATESVTGNHFVGGLVGYNRNSSSIDNSYATGSVTGTGNSIGGLVGDNYGSTIDNSYATGSVTGAGSNIGGLVGYNYTSSIVNSYATGSVSGGGNYVGGLVGLNSNLSSIANSYATGSVSGVGNGAGGLVGFNYSSSVDNSYATGSVSGSFYVSGLVGYNRNSSNISNSFATGNVSGSDGVGGLVGYNYSSNIDNSYAISTVSGGSDVGGLVGSNYGGLLNNDAWWSANPSNTGLPAIGFNLYTSSPINSISSSGDPNVTGTDESILANFYSINEPVYALGTTTGWDFFTPTWDSYTNSLPHLAFEHYTEASPTPYFWTGAVSSDFNNLLNWSTDSVPTNGSTAYIAGGTYAPTLNTPTSLANLYMGYGTFTQNADLFLSGNYTQIAGTWDQNANLSISGNYSQIAGTFNSTITSGFSAESFNVPAAGASGSFSRFTGDGSSGNPYLIYDVYGLQGMQGFLASSFFGLDNDIDASGTSNWNSGVGFAPIGNNSVPFTSSTFDGNNFTISNLFINGGSNIGLFGKTVSGSTIENVGLLDVNINGTGQSYIGGLVGSNNSSSIENSYVTGTIQGDSYVGGLAGVNNSSTIDNSYATANVTGTGGSSYYIGGLVGYSLNSSTIDNSYATGNVSGADEIGGLVGRNNATVIHYSYATGSVTGTGNKIGGLVGQSDSDSTIEESYATGSVSGTNKVGGLVGYNKYSTVDNTYATGSVSGTNEIGGLIGENYGSTVDDSYASGAINGNGGSDVGGLVGYNYSTIIDNSYATGSVTSNGSTNVGGLIGDDHSGTYHNDWYANDGVTIVGIGNTSSGNVQQDANVSDYYNPMNPVYALGQAGGWDFFTPIWYSYTNALPLLRLDDTYTSTPYWTGTTSTDFDTASNWSDDVVPTAGSTFFIFSGIYEPTLSVTTTVENLLMGSGAFTQDGDLTITGNYIQGGGSFISNVNNTFSVAGSFTVPAPGSGGSFSRFTGSGSSNNPYLIYDVYGLQGVQGFLSSDFALANIIDASSTSNWNFGAGFTPIGNNSTSFSGIFNGDNYTISHLFIDAGVLPYIGLFGETSGASIENVGLTNVNITGGTGTGGLVGENSSSTIINSFVTGTVTGGGNYVGGLAGYNTNGSTIDNSYATSSVSGSNQGAGGLVGRNDASTIENSYATGNVTSSSNYVGGLVGINILSGIIINSYATGTVTGSGVYIGGLVGYNFLSGTIHQSYATGSVNGGSYVGGLVGYSNSLGAIDNSYATGNVSGNNDVGGLVGLNYDSTIDNSYAAGIVTGSTNVGGFLGQNAFGTYNNNFYNNSIGSNGLLPNTGTGNPADGIYAVGESTGNMQMESTFLGAGWDFDGLWTISGSEYPQLVWQAMNNGNFIGGTPSIPMFISNVNQLQFMYYAPYASFQLTKDIDASATSTSLWNTDGGSAGYDGFLPVGTNPTYGAFSGTFNGDGYTISSLYINSSSSDVGLFGQTLGATIENVGLTDVNITGANYVGGLVGYNNGSTIDNSYVTGTVSGTNGVGGLVGGNFYHSSISNSYATGSASGVSFVGGLAGTNYTSDIDNSYATSTVTGMGQYVGGLAGVSLGSSINNSYATGSVNGGSYVGGLVGYNTTSSSIDNSYATGSVSGSGNAVGGLVGVNYDSTIDNSYAAGNVSGPGSNIGAFVGQDNGGIYSNNFWDNQTSNQVNAVGSAPGPFANITGDITSVMKTESTFLGAGWDFDGLWTMSGSEYPQLVWQAMNNGNFIGGTPSIPMLISNVNQLQFMYYAPYASFELTKNIDASATSLSSWNTDGGSAGYDGFLPVGTNPNYGAFTGTFNGDNYTISGLYIDLSPSSQYVGLFGAASGATIENVGLANVAITGGNNVGGLVGYNYNTTIDDSYVTGRVTGTGTYSVGGLVGYSNGSSIIDNTYSTASVSGADYVGGLVGANTATIDNSYATGDVSGSFWWGGLVGYNHSGVINNSFAAGSVSSGGGGLVGANSSGSITNSYYTDTLAGGPGTPANASDFYGTGSATGGAVFTGTPAWDFTNIWLATSTYPILRFHPISSGSNPSSGPSSSGLLTIPQQNELSFSLPPEITQQGGNINAGINATNALGSGPSELYYEQNSNGKGYNDIYPSGNGEINNLVKWNLGEADHAQAQPWGVDLLPASGVQGYSMDFSHPHSLKTKEG